MPLFRRWPLVQEVRRDGTFGQQGAAGANGPNGPNGAAGATGPSGIAPLAPKQDFSGAELLALNATPLTMVPAVASVLQVPFFAFAETNKTVAGTNSPTYNLDWPTGAIVPLNPGSNMASARNDGRASVNGSTTLNVAASSNPLPQTGVVLQAQFNNAPTGAPVATGRVSLFYFSVPMMF